MSCTGFPYGNLPDGKFLRAGTRGFCLSPFAAKRHTSQTKTSLRHRGALTHFKSRRKPSSWLAFVAFFANTFSVCKYFVFKQNLSKGGIPRRGKAPMYPTERKRSLNTKDAVNKMPRTGFEPISSVPKTGTLAS